MLLFAKVLIIRETTHNHIWISNELRHWLILL